MPGNRVVVVGGGISGLSTAYFLTRLRPQVKLTLLEEGQVVGGTARTETLDGYAVDLGPTGFRSNAKDTLDLVDPLGLEAELEPGRSANLRYVYDNDELHPVPSSPVQLLRSRLLTRRARMRLLREPSIPRGSGSDEESVYHFAERRLGREFAETLATTFVRGTTGGDARDLSLAARFPAVARMEAEHGSLFRGLLATREGAPGTLTSFREQGLQRLSQALAAHFVGEIRTGTGVCQVMPGRDSRFLLRLASGETLPADLLVLAVPAHAAAKLLSGMAPRATAGLESIPYAPLRVVALGYDAADVPHPLHGAGFLATPRSGLRLLGCMWTSSLFPSQAPPGRALLRATIGNTPGLDLMSLRDDQALEIARQDVAKALGISAEPRFVHHVRWDRAIPQYLPGHLHRVNEIAASLSRCSGLFLTGNAYRGVGFDDCVSEGRRLAQQLAGILGGEQESAARGG